MKRRMIFYFTIFGLLLGLFNFADGVFRITGGYNTPRSVVFNLPALAVNWGTDSAFNNLQSERFRVLKQEVGLPPDSRLVLSTDEFNSLTPEEQQTFLSKVEQYKYLARNDFVIGEKGFTTAFNSIRSFLFPIISAIAWGIIGIIVYLIRRFCSEPLRLGTLG